MLDLRITQCILSLGSNHQAEHHLALARDLLQTHFPQFSGLVISHHYFSPVVISIDKRLPNTPTIPLTGTPLNYRNQIAWLTFSQPISLSCVVAFTKFLENQAERALYLSPIVTLDIDVLAIEVEAIYPTQLLLKNSSQLLPLLTAPSLLLLSKKLLISWYAISRRLPFASYDKCGINHLLCHPPSHIPLTSAVFLPII